MPLSLPSEAPLIGNATHALHEGVYPLVDFDAWLVGQDPAQLWEQYHGMQQLSPVPVLARRIADRTLFWQQAQVGKWAVLEHLVPAIIGVGNLPYLAPVTIYNEYVARNLIVEIMEPSDRDLASVEVFFDANIKNLNLGSRTPWFVRPNNWKEQNG